MARRRSVQLDQRTVTVRELTVGEIRDWLRDMDARNAPLDLVDGMLLTELAISDLCRMSDLPEDALDDLTQSEIDRLLEAARELNPHFFGMLARLAEAGRRLLESAPKSSSASPASS